VSAAELQVCTSTCQPGLPGSEPGEFQTPSYIAIDNDASSASFGDIYVGDTADNLVTKFTATGVLVATWGNNGAGASANGQLNGSPEERFNGGFPEQPPVGVAVDSAGNLWVFGNDAHLFSFEQNGTSLSTCGAKFGGISVGGLSAAGSGALYALQGGRPFRLSHACDNESYLTTGSSRTTGLAVDLSNDDLYVDQAGSLLEDIPASCIPSVHGCLPTQVFGEQQLADASGIAVDRGSGAVYAANAATNQILAFALAIEATIAPASEMTAHAAVVHGTVDPVGAELSRCRFEYGESTAEYGASVPCEESLGSIGNGNSPVAVHAQIAGLDGGTTYHFRLNVANGNGTAFSEDEHFATLPTAQIGEVSATELTGSSALLQAKVNPAGLPAHYHFEYGPCDVETGCSQSPYTASVPEPDEALSGGEAFVTVSQHIEGLSAGTTYHFRIVVQDASGAASPNPEATFVFAPTSPECRGNPAAPLPDCRAYEMVTPPEKNGALVANGAFMSAPAIAEEGLRVMAKSIQCFDDSPSCIGVRQTEGQQYSFERTAAGWVTTPLAPPANGGSTVLPWGYDADTGTVVEALAAQPPALEQFYAREPGGSLHPIGPVGELPGVKVGLVTRGEPAMTSDLSRLVYESSFALWPSLETGSSAVVVEYAGRGNSAPALVSVTGPAGSASLIGACGARPGGGGGGVGSVLSVDGRTVYITVSPCATGTGENVGKAVPAAEIYARIEAAHGMETVLASGPGPESVCGSACGAQPAGDASFQGASADGSRVFFTSTQQLTDSANEDKRSGDSAVVGEGCTATAASATGCNLYKFECPNHCEVLADRRLLDVSAGDSSGLGPQVQGVMAIPPDGSGVYFVARGVLTEVPNSAGQHPVPGGENLYANMPGSGGGEGHVAFIATLARSDNGEWSRGRVEANVTPDGRFLLFTSHRALTADTARREGPAQVYRYDAQSTELTRVSVGQQGFGDNGNAATADARIVPAYLANVQERGPHRSSPSMSDNGQVVFFQTPAGLTPGALNDHPVTGNPKVLAENVYEWRAPGAHYGGTPPCEEPGGCVSLISDGRDLTEGTTAHNNASAVELLGVDATGENVFFWTADQLVPTDRDSQVDLYDARVDGGFPVAPEPVICASLGECHPPVSSPPVFQGLASSVFSGSGNLFAGGGTTPPKPPHLTPAQELAQSLKVCSKKPGRERSACERGARARYRAQLLVAALRACRAKAKHARARCERKARTRYGKAAGAQKRRRTTSSGSVKR
jgi:hypothetical protein